MLTNVSKKEKNIKFKYINKPDFDFFQEILTAETIGGHEYLIKDTLVKKLEYLNFRVEIDAIGNIYAVRGVAKKYPMLNAHMDIVDCSYSWSYGYSAPSKSKKSNSIKDMDYLEEAQYRYEKILECDECSDYDNSYNFYTAIYEEINFVRASSTEKGKYLKDVFEALSEYIQELTENDYENMGYDCFHCQKECKRTYLCPKFKLHLKNDEKLEMFIDALESYCIQAIEDIENLADEAIAYEMSFEDEFEEEYEDEFEEEDKEKPEYEVIVDLENDKIYGRGKSRVLGGDDKCGIFIALKVAEMLPDMPMKMLFTVKEESGCVGISYFEQNNLEFFNDVKYSLTIDRRDKDNLLWSQLGTRSCDDEFAAKVAREGVKEGIHVKLMDGSVADVIHIRNHVPNSINMSAGYYNAHSSSEYIVPTDVDNIIGWVKNILINV